MTRARPLYTGERVSKGCQRVETYGTIDEVDSVLGEARAFATHDNVKETIYAPQKELWLLMADVASVGKEANITPDHVTKLEQIIDTYTDELAPLDHFWCTGIPKAPAFLMWRVLLFAVQNVICGVFPKRKRCMKWISAT